MRCLCVCIKSHLVGVAFPPICGQRRHGSAAERRCNQDGEIAGEGLPLYILPVRFRRCRAGSDMSIPASWALPVIPGRAEKHSLFAAFANHLRLARQAGTGPDEAHFSKNDIEELRQFIELVGAQPAADRGDPGGGCMMGGDIGVPVAMVRNL